LNDGFSIAEGRLPQAIEKHMVCEILGLQVANSIPEEMAQREASGKIGGMKTALWKTKIQGNLSFSTTC